MAAEVNLLWQVHCENRILGQGTMHPQSSLAELHIHLNLQVCNHHLHHLQCVQRYKQSDASFASEQHVLDAHRLIASS